MEPNVKNAGKIEGIPVDLDERTVKSVAKMVDYVSMGERLVVRAHIDSYRFTYRFTYRFI